MSWTFILFYELPEDILVLIEILITTGKDFFPDSRKKISISCTENERNGKINFMMNFKASKL